MKLLPFIGTITALVCGVLSEATEFPWTGDCKRTGPVKVELLTVGATEGIARCETRWSQALAVSGFSAWYEEGDRWIRGIQLRYQDGAQSEVLGNQVGKRYEIEWNSGNDFIKTFTLWPDEKGDSIGHIYIETTNGKKLDVGGSVGGRKGKSQPVGGGLLLGVRAFTSWKVDGLSPIFSTNKISEVYVDGFKFDIDPIAFMKDKKNLKKKAIGEVQKFTAGSAPMVFYMRGTRKYTETTRFITDDTRIGLSTAEKHPITYDVLFPRVVGRIPEDSSKPIWYQGWNKFKSWETEFSRDVPYEHAIEASPGQTLYCKTFIYYGEFVSGYTSTVKVNPGLQELIRYTSKGRFSAYTESGVGVECLDSSEVDKRNVEKTARRTKRGFLGR